MLDPAMVQLLVAVLGGGIGVKLLDIVIDKARGASEARRREVDRMAGQLREAETDRDRARRRERIATEHAHEVRVIAMQRGATSAELPELDFKDD